MTKNLIQNSINKAYTYSDYRKLVKLLISSGQSTNKENNEALFEFSKLNDKRMDRLDKTLRVSQETLQFIQNLNKPVTFLVISEGWCGDAAQIVPVINKIAASSELISMKIVLRDENEELMNQFLTNGNKSIPMVILVDSDNNVLNSWGPRPSIATQMVLNYKKKNGGLDADFKRNLQVWYNKDRGLSTQKDLVELLATN
jgi:hypothetical protein